MPLAARHAHLFPDISYRSLLSVGQFCDAGYRVLFDDTMVYVLNDKGVALTGHRDPVSRLYLTPLGPFSRPTASPVQAPRPSLSTQPGTTAYCCNAYAIQNAADLVTYLHQAAFSPSTKT